MKTYDFKFSTGSLFICSKCGKSFDNPEPDRAEKMKADLKGELAKNEAHKKVRVMVSSCLGVCINNEQTFAYFPHQGKPEVYTTEPSYDENRAEILKFIKTKI